MEGYLGETILDVSQTEYKDFTPNDWVMLWIEMYSRIDGSHHKDWLIDQIAQILKGTKIQIKLAKWDNGFSEERFDLEEPTQEYFEWVEEMKDGEDGPNTYSYDAGVAP